MDFQDSNESVLFRKYLSENDQENEIIHHLISQKWSAVLQNENVKKSLELLNDMKLNGLNLISFINGIHYNDESTFRLSFYAGIASLQLFIIENFVGPIDSRNDQENSAVKLVTSLFDGMTFDFMNLNGESKYKLANDLSLLKCSLFSLVHLKSASSSNEILLILWKLRALIVFQMIIDNHESCIYEEIISSAIELHGLIKDNQCDLTNDFKTQLYIEMFLAISFYGDIETANNYLEEAKSLCQLDIEFTGALGYRTQYQQNPLSQLLIKIKRINGNQNLSQECHQVDLPKIISLIDDTLLTKVKFLSLDNQFQSVKLSPVEQTVILAIIYSKFRGGASDDELLHEELLSFIDSLISNTTVWLVQYKALLIRSLLEKEKRRKVERSMMQLDELVEIVRGLHKNNANKNQRSEMFFAVLSNPIWIMEKYLADILVSLGVTKTALEIYLRLQFWDDVITCYQRLERRDKAEEIIRERLAIEETPYLYCLLGDVTEDIEFYKKSWELSKEKYFRAPKSLGNYHFKRKEYQQCIDYYTKSLDLNSMQLDVWYRLAFAALDIKNYELSAKAYRRVVHFESNSFEAWNNLSKVYIKLKQKQRAWKTLQEALKCNYDEWRIWENYIAVSVDIGAFGDAIQAWHRLIDLKGKYLDDQILEILVLAVCDNLNDVNSEPSSKLKPKLRQLLGRITSTSGGSYKSWKLYGQLIKNDQNIDYEKLINCHQKCHQSALQITKWENHPEKIIFLLEHCLWLADQYYHCSMNINDVTRSKQILGTCKMAINSVLTIVKKQHFLWNNETCDKKDEINSLITNCQKKIDFLIEKLNL